MPAVALELGLRAIAAPSDPVDPFVGFRGIQPLFELDETAGKYRTAAARRSFFATQEFARTKPAGGLRIFCLGGSTVLGHPFQPDTAFSAWLAMEISGNDASRSVEVVNCGGISYASYRLRPILEEVLRYEPDAIIVASGHNEFLEDRTYREIKECGRVEAALRRLACSLRTVNLARGIWDRLRSGSGCARTVLPDEVDARLDHESGYAAYHRDNDWHRSVAEHYRHNLLEMVERCRRQGVPIVLVRLGSNLRDCPPFKAEPPVDLPLAEHTRWQNSFELGQRLEPADPAAALAAYRKAEALDATHPLLAFRMARCLDRLGRLAEAKAAYQQACDRDVCPLRMTGPLHDALTSVVDATGAALVDARNLLDDGAPGGIPGNDWYLDHVHPNISGHQRIAEALFERLAALGVCHRSPEWNEPARRAARRRHLDALGERYFAQGKLRVEWLDHWARRDRLREQPADADVAAWLRLGHAQLDFADWPNAQKAYRRGLSAPGSFEILREHAEKLRARGQGACASRLETLLATHK